MRACWMIAAALLAFAPAVTAQDDAPASFQPSAEQLARDAAMQAVEEHIDAYLARDLERFALTFAPNATVNDRGLKTRGRDAIRELYRLNFDKAAPAIRVAERGFNGERVYLSLVYTFPDGGEWCCSYSEYIVRHGKIVYLEASS